MDEEVLEGLRVVLKLCSDFIFREKDFENFRTQLVK